MYIQYYFSWTVFFQVVFLRLVLTDCCGNKKTVVAAGGDAAGHLYLTKCNIMNLIIFVLLRFL
ncbi:hypothetical protein EGH67_24930 [Klebsiella aerogenes]|nr:hypothetical protein [Salmonella enterica]ECT6468356.1 hypothetical protein [Salmonella enterica subsp. enterica serovar Senegal]KLE58947.1 hypothetical protein YA15_24010 [Klebsiella aerogenes]KSB55573.1 hypothetical protein LFZ1_12895 [Salmonella enterica subsp. enterica serovar Rubislaw str. SA20030553]KLF04158.1 hypothetical protein YA26_24240 [Klebsiella aerogenes]